MRKKLNLYVIIIVAISIVIVASLLTLYSGYNLQNVIRKEKKDLVDRISDEYYYFSTMVDMVEKNIYLKHKNELINLAKRIHTSEIPIDKIPLDTLMHYAQKVKVDHLYLINKNGEIVNASLQKEIGYDLKKEGKAFMRHFNALFSSNEFVCQSLAVSSIDNALMFYTYYVPPGADFVLEASVSLADHLKDHYNRNIEDLVFWGSKSKLISKNELIADFEIYNLIDGSKVSFFDPSKKLTLSPHEIDSVKNTGSLSYKIKGGEEFYKYIILNTSSNQFPVHILMYVKFKYRNYIKDLWRQIGISVLIFLLVLLGGWLISVKIIDHRYIKKVEIIKHNLEAIKKAEYNKLKKFSSNDELSSIADHIIEVKKNVMERENQLNVAKVKAEESDRLKSAFLANMSHEIRTPLNAIVGFSQLLEQVYKEVSGAEEFVTSIVENSDRLLQVITDIIDVSQLESKQIRLNYKLSNIHELVLEMFELLESKIKSYQHFYKREIITCSCNVNKSEVPLIQKTDPYRLKQILQHLVDNAAKFTEKGTIALQFSTTNEWMLFKIVDTGVGIRKKDQEKIFYRFNQVAENHLIRDYGGTGLGLAISNELAILMDGELRVESEINKGSTFTLKLPLGK